MARLSTIKPRVQMAGSRPMAQADANSWRSGKTTAERGYGGRWQKARERFLAKHPLCAYCEREGKVTAASVVDHVVPHRGDQALFWQKENWQSLCATCHSSTKQQIEKTGIISGCDVNGAPIDPNHHWAQ